MPPMTRAYWRSLEEFAQSDAGTAYVERAGIPRRDFLRLLGASLALAGGGCTRQPEETIVPYAARPEDLVPGRPLFYATAMPRPGGAVGVLAESHLGRPTKLEGNPEHPASLGASDAITQAQVLGLYDPDRSRAVLHAGQISTWDRFLDVFRRHRDGLAVLTEPVSSPTLEALLARAGVPHFTWSPVHRDAERRGAELAFGRDVAARYHFDRAPVVLSIDADFLGTVRYARDFMSARRGRLATKALNRLYAVETTPTVTGAMADHRLALPPAEVERFARGLMARLDLDTPDPRPKDRFLDAVARDLRTSGGVVVPGPWQPVAVHAMCHAINAALETKGVTYNEPVETTGRPIGALAEDMRAGDVKSLLILGGNPVYDAPADVRFAAALQRVPFRAHLSLFEDETSRLCHWHLPEAHFLESWGDARAFDGTVSFVQPLIAPLFGGRSAIEIAGLLTEDAPRSGYDLVRAQWQRDGFERFWRTALHDGVVPGTAHPALDVSAAVAPEPPLPPPREGQVELVFRPDASVLDGRFANNGWLQETPRPLTRLTWDNAALVAPALARRMGFKNGDVVALRADEREVRAPVWIAPGHADGAVTLHLGYGRRLGGRVAAGVGVDVYPLRAGGAWRVALDSLEPTGDRHELVSVQDHDRMEGRDLVRRTTLPGLAEPPAHAHGDPDALSMYPEWESEGYAWGMVIDLNACTGCNACMVACQAENNIPVVGKQQVARGREMHWIRVDRYHAGPADAPETVHQPVPCMHCERAPCEVVCPVAATVHSDEGLNDMVYNRCVGTRYCSNNCPYKVRRFNFYKYADTETEVAKLGRNPDVTVRTRGVMEKCTYCVQRINRARIGAKLEDRTIRDGEVRTACLQACPTQAIFFGDISDPKSQVAALREEPHHYALLGELGTKPRTTYLARLSNPNPELA